MKENIYCWVLDSWLNKTKYFLNVILYSVKSERLEKYFPLFSAM